MTTELTTAVALELFKERAAKMCEEKTSKMVPGGEYGWSVEVLAPRNAEECLEAIRSLPTSDLADEAKRIMEDAERYRWLNKQHNFLIYIESVDQIRTNVRLRCGEHLSIWIDAARKEKNDDL